MSYIEREALLKSLESKRLIFEESTPVDEAIAEQVSVFEEAIEEAPTADVVEVKHGCWIRVESSDMATGIANKCSECGKIRYGSWYPPYCAICGTKMDGVRSENDS